MSVQAACEACGWLAATASMLAFGSFGVPIKSDAAQSVDIDPLVFQSYKTFMCFATSWLVLAAGEEFTFTPWGIVSGLFWVPGGVATVYAIKAAGLAIGIGIGSSFIVLVSFVWGIFVFDERVHSRAGACFAIFCMMLGLFGMSYYSSPETAGAVVESELALHDVQVDRETQDHATNETPTRLRSRSGNVYRGIESQDEDDDASTTANGLIQLDDKLKVTERTETTGFSENSDEIDIDEEPSSHVVAADHIHFADPMQTVVVCGMKVTRRQLGMLSAAFCGIYGGSIMAPMKSAPPDAKGTHYLLSFAIGASIVTLTLWLFRYLLYVFRYKSLSKAYTSLPSFHIRVMWLAGGTSGLLWSIGNYFSLISVFYLGEGVGYPLVQTSILVSGLWGIFYFKEVTGTERIAKWLCSSLLTIFGILLLSYEHHEK